MNKQHLSVQIFPAFILVFGILLAVRNLATADNPADPMINEFVADHVGADVNEYIEIFGNPDTNYSTLSVIQLEGDSSLQGRVDSIHAVGTTDANGYWTTGFLNSQLENGTMSLLLVEAFSGSINNDLDTDNDGVLDVTPWIRIVDAIAIHDGDIGDLTYTGVYTNAVLTPNYDGFSARPGGASRIPNGVNTFSASDWVRNDYDRAGLPGFPGTPIPGEAYNTPGAINQAVASPARDLVINEIDYNQPGSDTAEFIEIYNADTVAANLLAYTVRLVNGADDSVYQSIALPDFDLAAGAYFVICGNAANVMNCDLDVSPNVDLIQNGAPDAVALTLSNEIVDVVSYDGDTSPPYVEGSGVGLSDSATAVFTGISRFPNGVDTAVNNVDFSVRCITPGQTNSAQTESCADPGPTAVLQLQANPLSVIEPGGLVTFTVNVSNTSIVSVTITSLVDSIIGDLGAAGTCATPQSLLVSGNYECQFAAQVSGQAGQMISHTVTAVGQDAAGHPLNAAQTISVTIREPYYVHLPAVFKNFSPEEPNDICTQAYPISINQTYAFLPDDVDDWYRFDLATPANITVHLTNFTPELGQIVVYGGALCGSLTILGNDGSQSTTKTVHVMAVQPVGRYYIRVINDGQPNNTPYQLWVDAP